MITILQEQPRAFRMIFMLELWERFGYYTVQGILTLYFIRFIGLSDSEAYFAFGAFSALVYGMVSIGGYIGDHILGTKRTIALGLATLTLGYLSLALTNKQHVFLALGLICVGNGLFKANPSNLLSKCYKDNDPRLHSAFTLYYMAINLGSIFSLFIGPALASHYGYSYSYFASFIGLILGNANYWFQRQHIKNIHTPADLKKIQHWKWGVIIIGILLVSVLASYLIQHVYLARKLLLLITTMVLAVYLVYMRVESKSSAIRMIVALILMIEAIIFFVLYQQMPTSLNFFAVHNVNPFLLGISIDPQSFQALNPIWIISLSPLLAMFYHYLQHRGISFPTPYKFAAGMFCCSLSFLLLYFSQFVHDENGIVSSVWLIGSYFFQASGELLVSALGVAMVAELVPRHITGFVMGMWFLTSSIAGFLGATVASFTALPKDVHPGIDSLTIYTHVFGWIGCVIFFISVFMLIVATQLSRFIKVC